MCLLGGGGMCSKSIRNLASLGIGLGVWCQCTRGSWRCTLGFFGLG